MRSNLYHVCISSSELLFRVHIDYAEGINRLAISAFLTDTTILAYALMSNHVHLIIRTCDVPRFVNSYRIGYNKWFNSKYLRSGRLGDKNYHLVKLEYMTHILGALCYVLKNGVHHNVVKFPFEYEFCSAKYYFMSELGIEHSYSQIEKMSKIRSLITYRGDLPPSLRMDISGMFIPEYFLAINLVEQYYGSVRQFVYHMNKPLTEELSVINLETWTRNGILPSKISNKVLHITDIKICTELDATLEKRNMTYAQLSIPEKLTLSDLYIKKYGALLSQMERCLSFSRKG